MCSSRKRKNLYKNSPVIWNNNKTPICNDQQRTIYTCSKALWRSNSSAKNNFLWFHGTRIARDHTTGKYGEGRKEGRKAWAWPSSRTAIWIRFWTRGIASSVRSGIARDLAARSAFLQALHGLSKATTPVVMEKAFTKFEFWTFISPIILFYLLPR